MMPVLLLASASPRRSALLNQIHVAHAVRPVLLDETRHKNESPDTYVSRLAVSKAQTLWRQLSVAEQAPVLAADTAVAVDQAVLGKPRDRAAGLQMLAQLSGRTHRVYTAVALCWTTGVQQRLSVSEVTFRALTAAECVAYWNSGEPQDKAGGYAVQGLAAAFITHLSGSYSGVMGLPLAETAELLHTIGWQLGALTMEVGA